MFSLSRNDKQQIFLSIIVSVKKKNVMIRYAVNVERQLINNDSLCCNFKMLFPNRKITENNKSVNEEMSIYKTVREDNEILLYVIGILLDLAILFAKTLLLDVILADYS